MASKENKGGEISNEQLEQDLRVKGKNEQAGSYIGTQDTGDGAIRSLGNAVQQRDGLPAETDNKD